MESYWPLYSNPGQRPILSAPIRRSARRPGPVLSAGAQDRGRLGRAKLISNTSYYHRKDETGYDGTLYNLGFYQTFFGPDCSLQLARCCSTATACICPPGATNYRSPASVDNYQQNITQEIRLQSNDPTARADLDHGRVLQRQPPDATSSRSTIRCSTS